MSGEQSMLTRRALLFTGGSAIAGIILAACSSSSSRGGSGVDLSYGKKHVSGSWDGKPVSVATVLPLSAGSASGSFAGRFVDAHWSVADSTSDQTFIPATVGGTVAGISVSLNGTFNRAPNFLFESGTIAGTAAGSPVHAQVQRAQGESSSSVNVQGNFAGVPFSLYGTLAGDLNSGYVQGTVGGKSLKITASRRSQVVDLTGTYSGPSDLLALIVGALLYFL